MIHLLQLGTDGLGQVAEIQVDSVKDTAYGIIRLELHTELCAGSLNDWADLVQNPVR